MVPHDTTDLQQLVEDTQHPLSPAQLDELRLTLDECPFHHVARIRYVAALYQAHSPQFGEELRKASLLVPQPAALLRVIEGKPGRANAVQDDSSADENQLPILTEHDDRTTALIDHFLAEAPDKEDDTPTPHPQSRSLPTLTDVTSDYAAFLSQQPNPAPQQETQGANTDEGTPPDLIEQFIASTHGRQRYELDDSANNDEPVQGPPNPTTEDQLYNERIVDLLIKQGNYQQALQILKQLCKESPRKNLTFAARLRLLEAVMAQDATQ